MPDPDDPTIDAPWWKHGVVYQIYPRSFADGSGDGVGDLAGLLHHVDHLVELGVDAVWLSPIFPSPMADFGYDVADFCDIDPLFGDLATFDRLVDELHAANIRLILDWVPNHTSERHPWFVESRSNRSNPKRDWYFWRDAGPDGGRPNNWTEALTFGPAWTFDDTTGQYYLHNFLPQQPDLNWGNPEVVDSMLDTLRFWLDRGVDGFRMDVVNLIGKDPSLADDPDELVGLPHLILNDRPETHALLRTIRSLLDTYDGDRMAVGETVLLDTERVASHYGHDDELHLCFNFAPMDGPFTAEAWRRHIRATHAALGARDAWPSWVISNHDVRRVRTRLGGDERAARAAAVVLLTLRGTPFIYAGDELGLEDAAVEPDRMLDPAGRDGCRAPIPWTADPAHGWPTEPWLPWPPDPATRNAESQRADPDSMWSTYRSLLRLRRSCPALSVGSEVLVDRDDDLLVYDRSAHGTTVRVVVNLGDSAADLGDPSDRGLPLLDADDTRILAAIGDASPTRLGPWAALIVDLTPES